VYQSRPAIRLVQVIVFTTDKMAVGIGKTTAPLSVIMAAE
jgi:hypothetical protein